MVILTLVKSAVIPAGAEFGYGSITNLAEVIRPVSLNVSMTKTTICLA